MTDGFFIAASPPSAMLAAAPWWNKRGEFVVLLADVLARRPESTRLDRLRHAGRATPVADSASAGVMSSCTAQSWFRSRLTAGWK